MNSQELNPMFENFGRVLIKEFGNHGFRQLDPAASNMPNERHGGWEWIGVRQAADVTRYVTVRLTLTTPAQTGEPRFFLYALASADAEERCARREVARIEVNEGDLRAPWPRQVWDALELAVKTADKFSKSDLKEQYFLGLDRRDTRSA